MVEKGTRVKGAEFGAAIDGERAQSVTIHADQGDIACLYHEAPRQEAVVLWAGAWRGEGEGLRSGPIPLTIAEDLAKLEVSSLRLRYRHNGDLPACVRDTQAAVLFLESLGFKRIALVGHSFSGAVVISAAPLSGAVVAVVTLASQTFGAQTVAHVFPRPLLLVHGTADQRLNCYCSEQIYSWARRPKDLVLLEGGSHGLWESRDRLLPLLRAWLIEKLQPGISV